MYNVLSSLSKLSWQMAIWGKRRPYWNHPKAHSMWRKRSHVAAIADHGTIKLDDWSIWISITGNISNEWWPFLCLLVTFYTFLKVIEDLVYECRHISVMWWCTYCACFEFCNALFVYVRLFTYEVGRWESGGWKFYASIDTCHPNMTDMMLWVLKLCIENFQTWNNRKLFLFAQGMVYSCIVLQY